MSFQNVSSVPNQCVQSKTLNQNTNLQTVYNSKCNDHLTPHIHNATNAVNDIRSNKTWSNVRGFGFIQQANCDAHVSAFVWNRVPTLKVRKDNNCA
jgi:hypothetical protein